SATDSRRLAKATSRMDRARRRVSHVRFLRVAAKAAPRNLCPVGAGRSCLTFFRFETRFAARNASPVEDSPHGGQAVESSDLHTPQQRLISSHERRKDAAAPNIPVIRDPGLRSKSQKLCHCHPCRTAIVSIGHTFNSANHRLSHRSRDLY